MIRSGRLRAALEGSISVLAGRSRRRTSRESRPTKSTRQGGEAGDTCLLWFLTTTTGRGGGGGGGCHSVCSSSDLDGEAAVKCLRASSERRFRVFGKEMERDE